MQFSALEQGAPTARFHIYATDKAGRLKEIRRLPEFEERMKADDALGLIVYDNPCRIVVECLADDVRPEGALQAWDAEARRHVAALRKHRGRILVIEQSGGMQEQILDAFHSFFPASASLPTFETPDSPKSALLKNVGAAIVQQNASANRLLTELRASGIVSDGDDTASSAGLDAVIRELKGLQQSAEEKTLLLRQVFQLQTSLREAVSEAEKVKQRAQEAEQRARKEIEACKEHIKLLYNSTSWRVSAPLRAVSRFLRRGKQSV